MNGTLSKAPRKISLYLAAMALAALVITVLAVSFTSNPAQAQNTGDDHGTPTPCGPGRNTDTASQPEPHEVTKGHFALFDAYWEWRHQNPNAGALHLNECPPKMVTTTVTEGRNVKKVTTPSVSHIDIGEALMHVLDKHKATVVATNDQATSGQLSLEEYPEVANAVSAGNEVWWLQLDDPDTSVDETSDLGMGFSTVRFDSEWWYKAEGKPLLYKFVVERNPGIDAGELPHFFAYRAPESGGEPAEIVWDSFEPGVEGQYTAMAPGVEYEALQWIFTKAGTYILSVHIQGYVRSVDDPPAGADEDWKPISDHATETSHVKQYTIQVGDILNETEPPMFGVEFNVAEDSESGDSVGDPIRVLGAEVKSLDYRLSGEGHGDFNLIPQTDPHAVQIVVNDGADLEYDTKSSYDLVIGVTDNKDHEGNVDSSIDHTIAVRIDLDEVLDPTVFLKVSHSAPQVGETVTLSIYPFALPEEATNISFFISEVSGGGEPKVTGLFPQAGEHTASMDVVRNSSGSVTYTPSAMYSLPGEEDEQEVRGQSLTVTWSNP